jgi:hypothetical protein
VDVTLDYGQNLDWEPLEVYGLYDIGDPVLLSTGYTIDQGGFSATTPDTYTITVTYKTYPAQTFEVIVADKVEDGFIIDHSAIDKTLDYGQALDLTPLVVHATYAVGDDELLATGYTVDQGGFSATMPNTYTITVTYKTYPAQTFEVIVADKVEDGFIIDHSAIDKTLDYGQALDLDGLIVNATYAVGDDEVLSTG